MEIKNKVLAYIEACKKDEDVDEMDSCLMAFTEKELTYMNKGKQVSIEDYEDTKNPEWCMRFDILHWWIERKMELNARFHNWTNETELYCWYLCNV